MDVFSDFRARVCDDLRILIARGVLPADVCFDQVVVEFPRDPAHGDLATNAAMVLSRSCGILARDLASELANLLALQEHVEHVEVAGPGFINLRLSNSYWHLMLLKFLSLGSEANRLRIGCGQRVNVEYVSANPTGPLHVGHCRGAVFGDALANLLEHAGYEVTREYYTNDAGAQVDVLARSVFLRYRQALGEEIPAIPESLYPGEYLVGVGEQLASEFGTSLKEQPESEWLPVVRAFAISKMMEEIQADLSRLNIQHDIFFAESSLHSGDPSDVDRVVAQLRERDLVYQGVLPPPKGQKPEDWEDREQVLFRASAFGDSMDRPLVKSNGEYTYFASDMAYFCNKLQRGFDQVIYVLGADHDGYVKRLEAVARAFSDIRKVALVTRLCRLVRLYRAGEPVKMSKRSGSFVSLRDVVEEVGSDSVRFMMLFRSNDMTLDFDFVKVLEQSRNNPVFYVQYAHARACSVLKKVKITPGAEICNEVSLEDLSVLSDEAERKLLKRVASFRPVLEGATVSHEPHRVAFYLYELASDFHALWNKGKELPQLRFVESGLSSDFSGASAPVKARCALVQAVARVLSGGMNILGVEALEEMS